MRRQMVTTMYNNQKPHPIIVYYMHLLISEKAFSMKVNVIFAEEKRFQMVDKEPEQIGQVSMRI